MSIYFAIGEERICPKQMLSEAEVWEVFLLGRGLSDLLYIMVTEIIAKRYFVFDLSKYLLNEHGRFKENTGIVLYSAAPDGVSILSTADNYDRPQIVEIQYEKEKENE